MDETRRIFAGSDDERLLLRLYHRARESDHPHEAVTAFVLAWEITAFVASDGFEWALEQSWTKEELVCVLMRVGLVQLVPYFERAFALVELGLGSAPRSQDTSDVVRASFEPLKELLSSYLDAADEFLMPTLGEFVRAHQVVFEQLLSFECS